MPILTRLLTIPWEKSPFQAQVYFIGKQTFLDQKWGTMEPISYRDPDFGMVRLRGFGKYSFRVKDSSLLVNTLVGTQGKYTTDAATSYFRDLIVSRLADILGTMKTGILDLPGQYDELAGDTKNKVADEFDKYGLELVDFFINAITPPEEVQKAIDARSSMGAVGDLNAFMKFQAANSMAKMAEQSGAGGGLGQGAMGMGMGAGFGMMMPGMIQQAMAGTGATCCRTSACSGRRLAGAAAAGMAAGPNFANLQAAAGRSQGDRSHRGYLGRLQDRRVGRHHANYHSRRHAAQTTGDGRIRPKRRRGQRGRQLLVDLRAVRGKKRRHAAAIQHLDHPRGVCGERTSPASKWSCCRPTNWPKRSTRWKSAKCLPPSPGRPIKWNKNLSARMRIKDEG